MIMLLHVTDDREHVYGVSIPRDTWVAIPGHGRHKINAAYSFGGPRLLVQTVESVTGVHIDHLAAIDWGGFRQLTDTLGGVDVYIPRTVHDSARKRTWEKGFHHLNGKAALDYVGQRYGLPNGDFDRVRRQQNLLRQLTAKMTARGTLRSPARLKRLLDAVVANVSVDDKFGRPEMFGLAWSLRSFSAADLAFYTVPNQGTGRAGTQSIVVYDAAEAKRLWRLFKNEEVTALERRFGSLGLGATVS